MYLKHIQDHFTSMFNDALWVLVDGFRPLMRSIMHLALFSSFQMASESVYF